MAKTHGPGGLHRDVVAAALQERAQARERSEEQGLAAGEEHVLGSLGAVGDELVQGAHGALGFPGAVGGVAPSAAQVAAAHPHEAAGRAHEPALALDRREQFGDREAARVP